MDRNELTAALAETDTLGRDVAERVITGLSRVPKVDMPEPPDDTDIEWAQVFGTETPEEQEYWRRVYAHGQPQESSPLNLAGALGVATPAVEERLRVLSGMGLIEADGDVWHWTGPGLCPTSSPCA